MKRILFIGLLLCGALTTTAGTGIGHIKGDLNCDGSIDVSDINLVINVMLERMSFDEVAETFLIPIGLDVNADDVIDATDARRLFDLTGDSEVDISDVNEVINRAIRL